MKRYLMTARGLGKVREDGSWVLRGVNLAVREGEFAAILGPPRSGKSMLLGIMGFRDRPVEGDLYWEERLVGNVTDAEMAYLRATAARQLSLDELRETQTRLPPLLLIHVEDPPADLRSILHWLHSKGHAIVVATADPETAAGFRTIYRMKDGTLRLLVSEGHFEP